MAERSMRSCVCLQRAYVLTRVLRHGEALVIGNPVRSTSSTGLSSRRTDFYARRQMIKKGVSNMEPLPPVISIVFPDKLTNHKGNPL